MKRALFSLYDTSRAKEFASVLIAAGWEIIASKETVRVLNDSRLPVVDIADFTNINVNYGFPPTLHPKIEAALTDSQSPHRIDLVYVINYPLSVGNDIGGRTLLALAAKGKRMPVTSIDDMASLIDQIKIKGKVSKKFHNELLDKTNALIAEHFFGLISNKEKYDTVFGVFNKILAHGENPYQAPADLFVCRTEDSLSLGRFQQNSGDLPCFTNLADSDCLIQTISLCAQAYKLHYGKIPYICAAAKHGNVCGLAIDWNSSGLSIEKALFTNPKAIWGGEVITNFSIDDNLAQHLLKSQKRQEILDSAFWMLDVIIAPKFTKQAFKILGKRKQRKLLQNPALFDPFLSKERYSHRFVRGGFLRQPTANYIFNLQEAKFVGCRLSSQEIDSLIIAWTAAYSSNQGGNELALAKNRALISCAGGPSTVEAAQLAVYKAKYLKKNLKDSVFCADAFFPFTDAPQLLIESGISAGVVPCGGKFFKKVKRLFKENNISVFYLPRQYRGFCRH